MKKDEQKFFIKFYPFSKEKCFSSQNQRVKYIFMLKSMKIITKMLKIKKDKIGA